MQRVDFTGNRDTGFVELLRVWGDGTARLPAQWHLRCNPKRQRGLPKCLENTENSLADASGYLRRFVNVSAIGLPAPAAPICQEIL
jgi:hypothetical protein